MKLSAFSRGTAETWEFIILSRDNARSV